MHLISPYARYKFIDNYTGPLMCACNSIQSFGHALACVRYIHVALDLNCLPSCEELAFEPGIGKAHRCVKMRNLRIQCPCKYIAATKGMLYIKSISFCKDTTSNRSKNIRNCFPNPKKTDLLYNALKNRYYSRNFSIFNIKFLDW